MPRLTSIPLINFSNINSFTTANQWTIRAGEANTLRFQLIDLESFQGNLRHMAIASPVVVSVTFPSIDDTQVITVTATIDSNDASIFSISLTNVQIPGSGNVQFSVSEGGVARQFSVLNMIAVEQINQGSC